MKKVFLMTLIIALQCACLFEQKGVVMTLPGDPFHSAVEEFDELVVLFSDPLGELRNHYHVTIAFLLENDNTDLFNDLREIYEKALLGDKLSLDQRSKAKSLRIIALRNMESRFIWYNNGMEIAKRYVDIDEWELTDEEIWGLQYVRWIGPVVKRHYD